MRTSFRSISLPALCLLAAVLSLGASPARAVLVDRLVAVVNAEPITLFDLQQAELREFGRVLLPEDGGTRTPADRDREKALLEALVEERLLTQRARERGIGATAEEIDETLRRNLADRGIPEDLLPTALAERGLTLESYREGIARNITISKLLSLEVRQRVVVTPEEVAAYYESHQAEASSPERARIRHILVQKVEGTPAVERRARAQEARQLLLGGADFAVIARQYSEDSSAARGEVSDWLVRGDLQPELETAVFELEPGVVSEVLETAAGFHLVRVEEREAARRRSLDELRESITAQLTGQKTSARSRAFIQELKDRAVIRILP